MNVLLFGCGQAGRMVKSWLLRSHQAAAFSDNNPQLWGRDFDGVPVIPPQEIPKLAPDLVWITVLNAEAARSISRQLSDLGYRGRIESLIPLRQLMDLRLSHLRLLAAELHRKGLPGAIAELGVYQGAFAAELNRLFPDRRLYLFDTFTGFFPEDLEIESRETGNDQRFFRNFQDTSIEQVKKELPYPNQAVFCPGHFPETLPKDLPELLLVSLDPDLYEPTRQGLLAFWPKLVPGGAILVHDFNSTQFPGAGKAVRQFCDERGLTPLPLSDLHGSAVLIKQGS